jgi:two-component system, OmpR family, response regulator VanR
MKHNSKVLIIDDDVACSSYLCSLLNRRFLNVYSANSGDEGWKMYQQYAPDTIITDIKMPGMDGTALVEKIRRTDSECFIVLMSAYSEEQSIERIANLQIDHYVSKPITPIKLSMLSDKIRFSNQKLSKQRIALNDICWYDPHAKTVRSDSLHIALSHKEIILLETFLEYPNEIISYDTFQYAFMDEPLSLNALRILIVRLRKKIPNLTIEPVYKLGYVLNTSHYSS